MHILSIKQSTCTIVYNPYIAVCEVSVFLILDMYTCEKLAEYWKLTWNWGKKSSSNCIHIQQGSVIMDCKSWMSPLASLPFCNWRHHLFSLQKSCFVYYSPRAHVWHDITTTQRPIVYLIAIIPLSLCLSLSIKTLFVLRSPLLAELRNLLWMTSKEIPERASGVISGSTEYSLD